jgi:hypothetical protein
MFMWDEAEYANLARDLSRGDSYSSSFRPPLVPLAAAAAILVSGDTQDFTLKVPVALFGVLGLVLVYGVMARHDQPATGLAAAGLLGLASAYWQNTSYLLTEVPFLIFFAGSSFFFVFGLYQDPRWFWACWFSTGLAFLTRYTAVLLGPTFVLYMALGWYLGGPASRARLRSRHFWLSPLLGLLVVLPWFIRQQLVYQDPLVGFRYASGQLQSYLPGVSFPAIFYVTALPDVLTWPVLLLACAGFAWGWKQRDPVLCHSLLSIVFLLAWFSCYRYKEVRLATSILPFFAIAAGVGLTRTLGGLQSKLADQRAVLAIVAALTALSARANEPFFANSVAIGYPSLKMTVERLRPLLSPNDVVMGANRPQLTWYLDHEVVGFPVREMLTDKLQDVSWVVIVNYERGQRPYLIDFVKETFKETDIRSGKVQVFNDPAGHATLLVRADWLRRRLLRQEP